MGTAGVLGDYYDPPGTLGVIGEFDTTPGQRFVLTDDYDTALWWQFTPWRDGYVKFDVVTAGDAGADLNIHGAVAQSPASVGIAVQVEAGEPLQISVQGYQTGMLSLRSSYYWDGASLAPDPGPTTVSWPFRTSDYVYTPQLSPSPAPYFLSLDSARTARVYQAHNGYLSAPASSVGAGARAFLRQSDNADEYIPTPSGELYGFGPADAVSNGGPYDSLPPGAPYPTPPVHLDFSYSGGGAVLGLQVETRSTTVTGAYTIQAMYWDDTGIHPPYQHYPYETRASGASESVSVSATAMVASMASGSPSPSYALAGEVRILSCEAALDHPASPSYDPSRTLGSARLFVRADSTGLPLTAEAQRGDVVDTYSYATTPTWAPFDASVMQDALDLEAGSTLARKLQFFLEPEELFSGSNADTSDVFPAAAVGIKVTAEIPALVERIMLFPQADLAEGDPESVHRIFCRPGG